MVLNMPGIYVNKIFNMCEYVPEERSEMAECAWNRTLNYFT